MLPRRKTAPVKPCPQIHSNRRRPGRGCICFSISPCCSSSSPREPELCHTLRPPKCMPTRRRPTATSNHSGTYPTSGVSSASSAAVPAEWLSYVAFLYAISVIPSSHLSIHLSIRPSTQPDDLVAQSPSFLLSPPPLSHETHAHPSSSHAPYSPVTILPPARASWSPPASCSAFMTSRLPQSGLILEPTSITCRPAVPPVRGLEVVLLSSRMGMLVRGPGAVAARRGDGDERRPWS
ncbi:hypothetical protein FB451DRAFT_102285 [Mycena latifolia]|nr:hypothetical protein FB451DRAFT_102285 [Mycena latifolia]